MWSIWISAIVTAEDGEIQGILLLGTVGMGSPEVVVAREDFHIYTWSTSNSLDVFGCFGFVSRNSQNLQRFKIWNLTS